MTFTLVISIVSQVVITAIALLDRRRWRRLTDLLIKRLDATNRELAEAYNARIASDRDRARLVDELSEARRKAS